MKKSLSVLLALFFILSSVPASAQQQDQQAAMKAWQEYMTPGPMHQMLAKGVGQWTTEVTMWMDPSQPPTKSEGTSVCDALLDGRYFQFKHSGTFGGMAMNGIEISGYDNAKKTFFSVWIDNFGTGLMKLDGTYDEATKTIIYTGGFSDATGKDQKVRETLKWIDDDNMYFEMFTYQNGKEVKTMEIKYTRKKA